MPNPADLNTAHDLKDEDDNVVDDGNDSDGDKSLNHIHSCVSSLSSSTVPPQEISQPQFDLCTFFSSLIGTLCLPGHSTQDSLQDNISGADSLGITQFLLISKATFYKKLS